MDYDASVGFAMNINGDSVAPNDPKQSFGITRRAKMRMDKQLRDGNAFYPELSYCPPHSKPQAPATTLKKYEGGATTGGEKGGRGAGPIMATMTEVLDTCIGDSIAKIEQPGIAGQPHLKSLKQAELGGRSRPTRHVCVFFGHFLLNCLA